MIGILYIIFEKADRILEIFQKLTESMSPRVSLKGLNVYNVKHRKEN